VDSEKRIKETNPLCGQNADSECDKKVGRHKHAGDAKAQKKRKYFSTPKQNASQWLFGSYRTVCFHKTTASWRSF
jgi:hypothetical protein